MKKFVSGLVLVVAVAVLVVFSAGCESRQARSAKMVRGQIQIVDGYIIAVPIKVCDIPSFVQNTGWKLMIEGNALDMNQTNRVELGVIACANGLDEACATPKFWDASGPIADPASNTVVYAIFWLDQNRG